MTPTGAGDLLPSGQDVPFAEIEATLARLLRDGGGQRRGPARASTATVVVVGTLERLAAAAGALEQLGESNGIRTILISEGKETSPAARVAEHAIAITGLAPQFLNNAVAALRLSSLPALVWWRGGTVEALDGLVELADRVVLDVEAPDDVWQRAAKYFSQTALTDLRWTQLTRWRSALAHLFDLPQVTDIAATFESLAIRATDPYAARLFAGWLRARFEWSASVRIEITRAADDRLPLTSVALEAPNVWISLEVNPGSGCLEAKIDGVDSSARIVPLPGTTLASLIGEELTVRTRDLAFEQALASAQEIPA